MDGHVVHTAPAVCIDRAVCEFDDHEFVASQKTTRLPERVGVLKSRALAARAARAALVDSDRELAREYGCSVDTVRKIATGVRWNPDAPKRRHR